MAKKKVFVEAGHDNKGKDPGAVGNGLKEGNLAVKVVNYACECLEEDYDCDLYKDISADNLNTITKRANDWGADLFVSVHFNAGGGDGYEALVYGKSNKALGNMFEKYVKAVGQNSRGVKYRPDLAVLRDTNMPAILNEIAFIDTKKDIKDWDENNELKVMGEALAKAIADWLNLPKKKTLKKGAKVKIKAGAKDLNSGKKYKAFVYLRTYTVISIDGNRVVFGQNGAVTGATNKSNIKLV